LRPPSQKFRIAAGRSSELAALGTLTIEGADRGRERVDEHRVNINIDLRRRNMIVSLRISVWAYRWGRKGRSKD